MSRMTDNEIWEQCHVKYSEFMRNNQTTKARRYLAKTLKNMTDRDLMTVLVLLNERECFRLFYTYKNPVLEMFRQDDAMRIFKDKDMVMQIRTVIKDLETKKHLYDKQAELREKKAAEKRDEFLNSAEAVHKYLQGSTTDMPKKAAWSKFKSPELILKFALGEYNYENEKRISQLWRCLDNLNNLQLKAVASKSPYNHLRWNACKKSGGHIYSGDAVNKCKCRLCGIQHHPDCPKNDKAWMCEKCGGIIKLLPSSDGMPHSRLVYPNGAEEIINGYDGVYPGEKDFL